MIKGMARDILSKLDEMALESVVLCGHSLGGKGNMRFVSDHPERVEKLIVVDMARDYPPEHHVPALDAMLSLFLLGRKRSTMLFEDPPNWLVSFADQLRQESQAFVEVQRGVEKFNR